MKRERTLQVVLVLVGLFYVALIYPLYTDLWHSKWLLELKNETEPMFLSFYVALGPFLLLAARKPSSHRSLIAFAAWSSPGSCLGDDHSNRGIVEPRDSP